MFTFNAKVKEELISRKRFRDCCRKAELAAFIWQNGYLKLEGKKGVGASIYLPSPALVRYVLKLTLPFNLETRIERTRNRGRKEWRLIFLPSERFYQFYCELSLFSGGLKLLDLESEKHDLANCCKFSFLRGIFLSAGYLSLTCKGYHLELHLKTEELRKFVSKLLLELDLKTKEIERGGKQVIYLKSFSDIEFILAHLGAKKALFELEDKRAIKSLKESVNRQVNCITANLKKISRAAVEQIECIQKIEKNYSLESLPASLQEIAWLRLKYPYLSLKELGEKTTPPISKSAVNNRLRRLKYWSEQLHDRKKNFFGRDA